MSDIAIRVENIGKLYRIGKRERYRTLRDTITDTLAAPFRRLRNSQSANGNGSPDSIWALKDLSFELKRGEVIGIIGRNGAGKSTLLKVLSRITEPTEGRAEIHGRVGSLLEVGTGFHPELTGRENIYLNGAILGMKRTEINRKFDEIVAFAEVEKFLDTPVKHYSSGMYMRLAFAVAAHLDPEIMVVDEVLAVGDAAFQKKCLGKMGEVAKQGRTVLFVSHNLGAIERLCERSILLHRGRKQREGWTRDVLSAYQSNNLATKLFWARPSDDNVKSEVRFLEVSVDSTSGHENQGLFAIHERITLRISYAVKQTLAACEIAIRLYTADGIVVFTSSDSDHADQQATRKLQGTYVATVTVPGGFLAPGTYSIFVAAHWPFHTIYDTVDQTVVFEVSPAGSLQARDGRLGFVTPSLTWRTETAYLAEPQELITADR